MGHKLLHAALADDQMTREAAQQIYGKLLEGGEQEAKAGDVARLKEAMKALGKGPNDLGADVQTLRNARRLQQIVRDSSGLSPAREAAGKAITDLAKEKEEWLAAWNRRHGQAVLAQNELEQRYMGGQKAGHDLAALKRDHPELLGHVEAIRQDQPEAGDRPAAGDGAGKGRAA